MIHKEIMHIKKRRHTFFKLKEKKDNAIFLQTHFELDSAILEIIGKELLSNLDNIK